MEIKKNKNAPTGLIIRVGLFLSLYAVVAIAVTGCPKMNAMGNEAPMKSFANPVPSFILAIQERAQAGKNVSNKRPSNVVNGPFIYSLQEIEAIRKLAYLPGDPLAMGGPLNDTVSFYIDALVRRSVVQVLKSVFTGKNDHGTTGYLNYPGNNRTVSEDGFFLLYDYLTGITLIGTGKTDDAILHLNRAKKQAFKQNNPIIPAYSDMALLGIYIARNDKAKYTEYLDYCVWHAGNSGISHSDNSMAENDNDSIFTIPTDTLTGEVPPLVHEQYSKQGPAPPNDNTFWTFSDKGIGKEKALSTFTIRTVIILVSLILVSVILLSMLIIVFKRKKNRKSIEQMILNNGQYAEKIKDADFIVVPTSNELEQSNEQKKYRNIYEQMDELFRTKQLYLDPHLTQTDVIKYLGTNRNYLYKALGLYVNNNFKSYINNYRIEYAKVIIQRNIIFSRNYVLSDIFSQCGFATNESFYRQFKHKTGLTPGEYAKIVHLTVNRCRTSCLIEKKCLRFNQGDECYLLYQAAIMNQRLKSI